MNNKNETAKKYYNKYKNLINEERYKKKICECGKIISKQCLKNHLNTRKHKDYINKNIVEENKNIIKKTNDNIIYMSLPTFDLNKSRFYNPPFTCALIGATRSGKTTFLNYLIDKIYKQFDLILLFSKNEHADIYKNMKKKSNVITFSNFSSEAVQDLYKLNKALKLPYNFLIIMDDEINNKNNKTVVNLFCILRNSNFSTIFCGQDYTFLAKSCRNNINYLFLFKQNNLIAYEDIYNIFLKGVLREMTPNNNDFRLSDVKNAHIAYLKEKTEDYNIIVLDIVDNYKLFTFKTPI